MWYRRSWRTSSTKEGGSVIRLGLLVGEDHWSFFREITEDLQKHYQVEIFQRKQYNTPFFRDRINRWAFQSGLRAIMQRNQLCFFEWASELLAHASWMPKRCMIVTRLHSFELYECAPKINWDAVDQIILVSHAMQEMFIKRYPKQAHKTVVIYNGRSLEKFVPPAHKQFQFNLGMLCYIAPIKRVYETVLMLSTLRERGYDARLYIAGREEDQRYTAATRRLVEMLGLQNAVIFEDHVAAPERWLQKIDIFISNSFWEGQQVALLEAMASGCYCLSHHWAGAEEMLPQDNLFIAEADLQEKIINYSKLPDEAKECIQLQLRNLACEKFDIARTKMEIRQIIEQQAATVAASL